MVKNPPASAGDKGSDFLIWKDPTYCGATNPVCCNCGACAPEPGSCTYGNLYALELVPQHEKPHSERPTYHNWRVAPARHN